MKTRRIQSTSKKWLLSVLAVCGLCLYGAAQNGVAINTTGALPDASAILDLSNGVSKGLLLPRFASVSAVSSPANGLVVYQTNAPAGIYCNVGTPSSPIWISLTAGTGTVTSVGLSMPSGFSVANSPITSSGTLGVTTTLNGLLYGSGSGFSTATVNAPIIFSGNTLSITKASSTTDGYLSSTDWNIFNNKAGVLNGNGYVKQTGTTTSYGPIPLASATDVTGILQTTNGGTGAGTGTLVAPNQIFAGPGTGTAAGLPTFRSVTAADIPSGNGNYIQNGISQQTASFNIGGSATITGATNINVGNTTTAITNINTGSSAGVVTIGNTSSNIVLPKLGTAGGVVYSSTNGGVLAVTAGTSGQVLTSNGSSAPTWTSLGQTTTTTYGTGSINTASYSATSPGTVVNTSVTLTSASPVLISTYGGGFSNSTSAYSATSVLKVYIDNVATNDFYLFTAYWDDYYGYYPPAAWSFSTSATLAAGTHAIKIVTYPYSGTSNGATISGSATTNAALRANLTVTVLKP